MAVSWTLRAGSLLFLFSVVSAAGETTQESVWSWRCQSGKCTKVETKLLNKAAGEKLTSVNTCKLTCAPYSTLWPKPSGPVKISSDVTSINPNSITFQNKQGQTLPQKMNLQLQELSQLFVSNVRHHLKGEHAAAAAGHKLAVTVTMDNHEIRSFKQDVDESYELTVTKSGDTIQAAIKAPTYMGVKHGTETLTQLITYDQVSQGLVMPNSVSVTDKPAYPYRGLLLDTARNFYPVASIKRTLDAMAASKLNTFHWHITDSQSFPMEIKKHPQLTQYGTYGKKKVYTHDDIKNIVHYAKVRGIRVVPEFDAPAHVGEGWPGLVKAGDKLDDYLACYRAEPWQDYCVEPPCGQLNPTSDKVYDVLATIYEEMYSLFKSDLFHMGGDEVNMNCWNTTQSIVQYMAEKQMDRSDDGFHELWNTFQQRALQKLEAANKGSQKPIIWTSSLTNEARLTKYLDPKKYIIQIWTAGNDKTIANLIKNKFPVIFSNYDALYMDCGFGAWVTNGTNWCSPFKEWQKLYENDPMKILADLKVNVKSAETKKLVLGAEAALWSEIADESNVDTRLWPRVSALGERLWSNPSEGWRAAEQRLLYHRQMLYKRGIHVDAMQPEWCRQNEGLCFL